MLMCLGVSLSLSLQLSLAPWKLMFNSVNNSVVWPIGQFFRWRILKTDCEGLSSSSSIPPRCSPRFRRRSTGCRWLSLALLLFPRPPPLPAGGEPAPVPRTLRPRCLLRRPPFRSLVPAAGLGAEGVREAEGEEVAEEDYGVCWSSLRTATERRTSTGGERDDNLMCTRQ